MANSVPGLVYSFKAGADLSAKQYYFVKQSAADTVVVCSGATDNPIGILQNAPDSGGIASVMITGISKVSSDAALTLGLQVGPSADGQADSKVAGTDATEFVCGRVLEASGAAGELATVVIDCIAPHNAVTAN